MLVLLTLMPASSLPPSRRGRCCNWWVLFGCSSACNHEMVGTISKQTRIVAPTEHAETQLGLSSSMSRPRSDAQHQTVAHGTLFSCAASSGTHVQQGTGVSTHG